MQQRPVAALPWRSAVRLQRFSRAERRAETAAAAITARGHSLLPVAPRFLSVSTGWCRIMCPRGSDCDLGARTCAASRRSGGRCAPLPTHRWRWASRMSPGSAMRKPCRTRGARTTIRWSNPRSRLDAVRARFQAAVGKGGGEREIRRVARDRPIVVFGRAEPCGKF